MKANTQLKLTTFLIFFGYMVIGTVILQTVQAIKFELISYWLFIPIYLLLAICSATFGKALALAINRTRK